MRTNAENLVEIAVLGKVTAPLSGRRWRLDPDGVPSMLPGVGGITYNCKVGDSALDWQADHVEPGVSVKNEDSNANTALNTLACVGNVGTVASGDAKGETGVVTGKHGGVEHVLMDFPDSTLESLVIGDKVQIRARGLGLEFTDLPSVKLMNAAPRLLERMDAEIGGEALRVAVTHVIPATLMGSGSGRSHAFSGDHDIQVFDRRTIEGHGLGSLRLGDLVAVRDADYTYGRSYREGAVSVGVVVHSRCTQGGHGPGLTALMTSTEGTIEPVLDPSANIAKYLRIGRARAENRKQ